MFRYWKDRICSDRPTYAEKQLNDDTLGRNRAQN